MEKDKKEKQRLRSLYSYNILDTLYEDEYDAITKIAAQICNAPISLISFVDPKRQWFKSHHGLDAKETPRDISFCSHAIQNENELMIIADAHKDSRFANNPLVKDDPKIVFYAGAPLVDEYGNALGTLCVIDIKSKELTKHQKESLKALSKQVMKLLELRKKNCQLEEKELLLKQKNVEMEHFLYAVTHDLKEPLNTIKGLIDLLKRSTTGLNDERYEDVTSMISKTVIKAQSLVTNLLQLARIGISQSDFTEINLENTIAEIRINLSGKIKDKNAEIIFECKNNMIFGIGEEIERLLQNLISNAIKYQKEGIKPRVEITCQEQGEFWVIEVKDNGIGISEKDREKLFQPFQRFHKNMGYEGTGLGLAICKKIVENHGGSIKMESNKETGTTFIFTLQRSIK